jgi:hypothetical protein
LREGDYVLARTGEALPGIDLDELCGFLDHPSTSAAIKAFRASLSHRS